MKTFCVFPYFNERDLLNLQVSMLHEVVDVFIVSEANRTHQGAVKDFTLDPDYLPDNVLLEQVDLTEFDDIPNAEWMRERWQRDALRGPLSARCEPDDLVISCDVDEIVNPEAIGRILRVSEDQPTKLAMRMLFYGLEWEHPGLWFHATAARYRMLGYTSLSEWRVGAPIYRAVADAGWHLSYCGDVERRIGKLDAFAHVEVNADVDQRERILAGDGFAPGGEKLQRVDLATLPDAIKEAFL